MATLTEIRVPDIGDFADVEVIEILVGPGDRIDRETSLITLESDKASMEVPSPAAGVIREIKVALGDKVGQGDLIATLEPADTDADAPEPPATASAPAGDAGPADADLHAEVVVLGAGPGGYTAAFRAADLGRKTVLVERYPSLGGVCLNVGCIPSKALLHTAQVIAEAEAMAGHGVRFGAPEIDLDALRGWKDKVVGKLTGGLAGLAKRRKITVVHGTGEFESANVLRVATGEGETRIAFDHAIIAAGSQAARIPSFPNDDPRLIDSTGALELRDVPARLLIIGGGIIGLEMATVYDGLGSKVTVVELTDGLMPGCDADLVKPLLKRIRKRYEHIFTGTAVTGIEAVEEGLRVSFDGKDAPEHDVFDKVLVAVGRKPNGRLIGCGNAGVHVQENGFIPVDRQQRTNVPHIFAIGDITGQPMLAHKATHEGKVAAEVIAGMKSAFDALTIPSVAYTDPEIAWMGVTEEQAREQGIDYGKASFPWAASGRSLGMGRDEGVTKLLFDNNTQRLIGAGITGPHAGDLIAEAVLALEMGADAADIGLTIHPHPTLSETIAMAAEMFEGTITDLYVPKRGK